MAYHNRNITRPSGCRMWRRLIGMTCAALLLSLSFATVSCGGAGNRAQSHSLLSDTITAPRYSSGWAVTGDTVSGVRVLTTYAPWQNSSESRRLMIISDSLSGFEVPEGFDGSVLRGVPRRVVAMSSTHVAMLVALGMADRVVGASGVNYLTSPEILASSRMIADVGYEGAINYEALAAARPDLVTLSAVNGASTMEGKLRELGIPFVYIGDYTEQTPLGKSEWVVAMGEIMGDPERGRRAFAGLPERYERWRKLAEGAIADSGRVPVMVNAPYGDSWLVPPEDSYMSRLIKDAGGEIIARNPGRDPRAIDMEEAWMLARKARVWLNPGMATDLAALRSMAPKVADSPIVTEGRVWNNTARMTSGGGNPFFEKGVMEPDVLLADLIGIFHPELVPGRKPVYYMNLK